MSPDLEPCNGNVILFSLVDVLIFLLSETTEPFDSKFVLNVPLCCSSIPVFLPFLYFDRKLDGPLQNFQFSVDLKF